MEIESENIIVTVNPRERYSISNVANNTNICNKLKCATTNAQSLQFKMEELRKELLDKKIQIAAITETWAQNWKEAIYEVDNYSLYRKDRTDGRKGGGCALYISKKLKSFICREINDLPGNDSVWCWVKPTNNTKVLVGNIYRSPSSTDRNNTEIMEQIKKAYQLAGSNRVLLLGDYNLKEIHWSENYAEGDIESLPHKFYECIKDCFLYQHVTTPTRFRGTQQESILDLIFTKEEDDIKNIEVFQPLGKSDHGLIVFDFICKWKTNVEHKPRILYFKGDYEEINKRLREINWEVELEGLDFHTKWQFFKTKLMEIVEELIPKSIARRNHIPWMNHKIAQAHRKKYFSWKRYMESNNSIRWREYVKDRNKYDKTERDERRKYEKSLATDIAENPKAFFNYVNSRLTVRPEIAALRNENGVMIFDDKEISNICNRYFHSVFNKPTEGEEMPEMNVLCEDSIRNITITPNMVEKQLDKLNKFKACGPDNIHPHVLKETASAICLPLSIIFNESLQIGQTPDDWKMANVSPIFKKGDRNDPANYRPVSLTSQVCKVMEAIIKVSIFDHMVDKNLLADEQHGFRTGRSCLSNLLSTIEDWTHILDQRDCVDVAYLDFKKAFDLVSHNHLLYKLDKYGINGKIGDWIRAFLENRKQKVIIRGSASDELEVLSGVPQGSVLGPILFLIYINDLPKCVECPVCLFADDSKIYCRTPRIGSNKPELIGSQNKLQKDLDELHSWTNKWKMKFNVEKCKIMYLGYNNEKHQYHLNGTELNETRIERDLGVQIDNELKFTKHISSIVAKANKMIGLIKISFDSVEETEEVKMFSNLYNTLIRPLLEYSVQVWSPHLKKDIDLLENVQRRATKMVRQCKGLSYEDRLKKLGLSTLEERRSRGDMILTYRLINGDEDINYNKFFTLSNNNYNLRRHSKNIDKTSVNLDVRKYTFSKRVVDKWNGLSEEIVSAPCVSAFKRRYDKMMRNRNNSVL